jgi:hypothetical protein
MFADEVNAAWRGIYIAGLSVKVLDEAASYIFYINHIDLRIY